jgi:dUTP pyrophosphatase
MAQFSFNTVGMKSNYALLKLYVNSEKEDLVYLYKDHVKEHNESMNNDSFPNSGFDIFVPEKKIFENEVNTNMINMEIKTEMLYVDKTNNTMTNCAYMVFPRSSISKTPLMLSNHTGIIDSGYRGWLYGAFRWLKSAGDDSKNYVVEKNTRLLQICHPSLCPIIVELVKENELSTTSRGSGGFGSTGLVGKTL